MTTTRIRALVVDDNGGVRDLIRILARRDGVDVIADAANGEDAIAQARDHRPDVVLLDVEMPVLDGIGAIPGILEASPESKIFMYSVYEDRRAAAFAAGAHGWINKGACWEDMKDIMTAELGHPRAS